jgi:hypothetical protein
MTDGPQPYKAGQKKKGGLSSPNRALRIEHMMKRSLYGGLGLGGEEVRGLGSKGAESGERGVMLSLDRKPAGVATERWWLSILKKKGVWLVH